MNGTTVTYVKDAARLVGRKAAGNLSAASLITASVLLASSAVSCVRNELSPEIDGKTPKEISFSLTPVKTGTKAATFSSFPADSAFGTFAWYLPDGKRWAIDSESAVAWIGQNGQDGRTEPERISYGNGLWKAWDSGKTYWWPQGGKLSFFSWAPANLTERGLSINTSEGLRIDGWKVPNTPGYGGSTNYGGTTPSDGSTDILTAMSLDLSGNSSNSWATSENGTDFTGYGAKIQFTHALCKVRFVIRLDYPVEGKKWYVEKAELKDIYTEGTLTGSTWGDYPWSSVANYSFSLITGDNAENGLEVTADEDKTIFPKTMMIPQPLASTVSGTKERRPRIEITVWDGSMKEEPDESTGSLIQVKDTQVLTGMLYSNSAESARWNESTDITYHLYLSTGTENYIEFDATVGSWDDIVDGGNIELK